MDPTRLHLIRHGAVAPAWRSRLYGCLDVPLSEPGRREAQRAAEIVAQIDLAAVFSSGLERAEFGAACIRAGRGLERRDEPALRELDRGEWAGLTFAELDRRDPGAYQRWSAAPHEVRPPGGENLTDLTRRVVPALARIAAEHRGAEIAIVTHSWVIRVAVCAALAVPPARCMRLDVSTGGMAVLDWPAGAEPEHEHARVDGAEDERGSLRPTLVGFGLDHAPDRGRVWFRGPHRG